MSSFWGYLYFELDTEIESMTEVIIKEERLGNIRTYFKTMVKEFTPGKMKWEEGYLHYNDHEEILLYHLIAFKRHFYQYLPKWKTIPNIYYIHEFYFSLHPYSSIKNGIQKIVLKTVEYIKFYSLAVSGYISWFKKYFVSRYRKMIPNLKARSRQQSNSSLSVEEIDVVGKYKSGKFVITIDRSGKSLIAKLDEMEIKIEKYAPTIYIARRPQYEEVININFRFDLEPSINCIELYIKAVAVQEMKFRKIS